MTSGLEDGEDPFQQARAYNTSILFMLCMPYVVLGGFGLLLYCKYRQGVRQAAATGLLAQQAAPTS